MPINCFRSPRSNSGINSLPGPCARPVLTPTRSKKSTLGRTWSSTASRTSSNSSIAALPSRDRSSDPKIEALMMPLPPDERGPPRCLRVSYPRIYSDIVGDMKAAKGCRDWRNFAVFHENDVDMKVSAEDFGRRKKADFERKMRVLSSFSDGSDGYCGELDTIG
ncbi:hypothetical protein LTR95_002706 [Oleoguttula sp. CCFEE 5521]